MSSGLEGNIGVPWEAEGLTMVRAAQHTVNTGTLWIWEWGRLLTTRLVPASVDSVLGQLCVCVCVCKGAGRCASISRGWESKEEVSAVPQASHTCHFIQCSQLSLGFPFPATQRGRNCRFSWVVI